MAQCLGLFAGEREHLLHAWRVRNVADHFLIRPAADLLLDFHADGFEIEAHLLQHIYRDALAQLDEPEQKMLGAHVVVVETVGFFSGQSQNLLRARREVVHHGRL